MSIAFIDLQAQARALGDRIGDAIGRVLDHAGFVGGPEVRDVERRLADFCGARHVVSCASGTDASMLALLAEGIGRGDAVFVPSFTFVATAEVVPLVGATPVFVDVRPVTFDLDPASLEAAIERAERLGLRPRAVVPVDLFGLPADYDRIDPVARRHGLVVIADTAQAFGAVYRGRRTGTLGDISVTSFFPAKPLGCYGDGGAVFTDDADRAALLRSLAVHGTGADKYDNVRVGLNSRLDTIQAAVLIAKLELFADEIVARDRIAARYTELLGDVVETPVVPEGLTSVWAQYTIAVDERDRFTAEMRAQGVPTAIYYATPLHLQTGYRHFPVAPGGLPVCERLARRVISLPMHAYLDEATQDRIVDAARRAVRRAA